MTFVEKDEYHFASRPEPIKKSDNLKPEGDFYIPEKPGFKPAERPSQKKPVDNLKPEEGEMTFEHKESYQHAKRPTPIKPSDNLKPEGEFVTPEKPSYKPGDRFERIIRKDNLRSEVKNKTVTDSLQHNTKQVTNGDISTLSNVRNNTTITDGTAMDTDTQHQHTCLASKLASSSNHIHTDGTTIIRRATCVNQRNANNSQMKNIISGAESGTHKTSCRDGTLKMTNSVNGRNGTTNSSTNSLESTNVSSTSVSTSKQFHHRKTEFSSESSVANSILQRKTVPTESNQFGSLTSNAKYNAKV
ncbi:hypothetical protein EVAR_67409_1 [Eumeta japonica]|uniref:Uncharacterized protein n=1 Tax=Eumeta variegata TaxID=151549 RepID=A0A4C2ACW1_EUMVA|nr:hypothetical protein EVAR_67409_1 [Eumeta japonica]